MFLCRDLNAAAKCRCRVHSLREPSPFSNTSFREVSCIGITGQPLCRQPAAGNSIPAAAIEIRLE